MIEKDIEKYLVRQVKQMGGLALKFVSPLYFVELKRPSGKPRRLQTSVHRLFEKLGFHVYVIDTKDKVDKLLRGENFEF